MGSTSSVIIAAAKTGMRILKVWSDEDYMETFSEPNEFKFDNFNEIPSPDEYGQSMFGSKTLAGAEPEEVSDLVGASKIKLVSKPKEVSQPQIYSVIQTQDLIFPDKVVSTTATSEPDDISKLVEASDEQRPKKCKNKKKKKSELPANCNQGEVTKDNSQPQEVIPPEDLIIPHEIEITTVISQAQEISEHKDVSEAELAASKKKRNQRKK